LDLLRYNRTRAVNEPHGRAQGRSTLDSDYTFAATAISGNFRLKEQTERPGEDVMGQIWKLNPSDFAFLWEECRRCFYLKVVKGFQRPPALMPKIFSRIDSLMKEFFSGKRTRDVLPTLPEGIVECSDAWVESIPFSVTGHKSQFFIRGKLDTVLRLDNASYAIIDFKTSETKSAHNLLYARQLNAYALGTENAVPGKLLFKPVTRLGLVVYEPKIFSIAPRGKGSLEGSMTWIDIPRNDRQFLDFISEVLDLLERAAPPPSSPRCQWCDYRAESRRTRF